LFGGKEETMSHDDEDSRLSRVLSGICGVLPTLSFDATCTTCGEDTWVLLCGNSQFRSLQVCQKRVTKPKRDRLMDLLAKQSCG